MKAIKSLILVLVMGSVLLYGQEEQQLLREHMVETQLKARDIVDTPVLLAMGKVPRHRFVPNEQQDNAYADRALPIGLGQTISQPYIVAFMTQDLRLGSEDTVLEIGTGSGYQAAILAELVKKVYSIEIVEDLGMAAAKRLKMLGYDNIEVRIGDGYHGWPEEGPFDAIMVTAGADTIPPALIGQLKEGGRMIIPIGPNKGIRQLLLVTKKNGKFKTKERMPVRFVPFIRKDN